MRAAKCGSSRGIAVSNFVHALDQVTCLLKLDGKEEGARGVVALAGDAGGVSIARGDLVYPEIETTLVREAAKEVGVLLINKEIGVVDGNWRVRAGSQAKWLYFDVAVVKFGREIGNLSYYVQCRCLSPARQGREGGD